MCKWYLLFSFKYNIVVKTPRILTGKRAWFNGSFKEWENGFPECIKHTHKHTYTNRNKDTACRCRSGTCTVAVTTRVLVKKLASACRVEFPSCMMVALLHLGSIEDLSGKPSRFPTSLSDGQWGVGSKVQRSITINCLGTAGEARISKKTNDKNATRFNWITNQNYVK